MYTIRVIDARKVYREVTALDDVNCEFEKGLIHGLIGRNGSGKTMMLKAICGLLPLTSGKVLVNDSRIIPEKKLPVPMGVIIETPGFLPYRSGMDNLLLLASINRKIDRKQIEEVMRDVGLDPSLHRTVSKYSLGMKQRLGIAQAIMEDPPILLLDEPFNGLDNKGVDEMRTLLRNLKAKGKTIILASHNKVDIDLLCDTVREMDAGKLAGARPAIP